MNEPIYRVNIIYNFVNIIAYSLRKQLFQFSLRLQCEGHGVVVYILVPFYDTDASLVVGI